MLYPVITPLSAHPGPPQSQSELFPVPARICHEPHVGTLERIDLQYLPWITTRSKVQGPSGTDSLSPAAPSRVWGAPPSLPSAVSLGASWKGYPGCPLQRGRATAPVMAALDCQPGMNNDPGMEGTPVRDLGGGAWFEVGGSISRR